MKEIEIKPFARVECGEIFSWESKLYIKIDEWYAVPIATGISFHPGCEVYEVSPTYWRTLEP